jgi:type IV fimbrial biogenesis protein FimT
MATFSAEKRPGTGRGFSLIELMIVLLLAGAILAIGAPSFGDMMRNSRLTQAANDFLAATQLARTEAIKRQFPVALCSSSTPADPDAQCNAGDFIGWIAFEDRNGDCVRGADEAILRTAGPLDTSIANASDGACISYSPNGFTQVAAGVAPLSRVIFCDLRGLMLQTGTELTAARAIQISRSGRPALTRDPVLVGSWNMPCSTR